MIKFLISIIFSVFMMHLNACCSESMYKLYPVGEVNNEVLFIEMDLFRYCKNGVGVEKENEFWIQGTVNLVRTSFDTLILINIVDSISFRECFCTYEDVVNKSRYENFIDTFYNNALNKAKMFKGFEIAKPKSIIFNDTLNTKIVEDITDSTFQIDLEYKEIFKFDITELSIISCYPKIVSEVRAYETDNYSIKIIKLRCNIEKVDSLERKELRFKKLETAFWKEDTQWHGVSKDFIMSKNIKK